MYSIAAIVIHPTMPKYIPSVNSSIWKTLMCPNVSEYIAKATPTVIIWDATRDNSVATILSGNGNPIIIMYIPCRLRR